ncbi:UNVERIFIED_CONTAM: Dimethyladenosine transferase (rRNA methylation) [Acetivibrio alkalicellulosi]
MNYVFRLKYRLKEEGFANTIRYFINVALYALKHLYNSIILDIKYSHRLLNGNKKSPYKKLGANDTYHTDYMAMPLIFEQISINPDDVLVDVGCGKGRVINFWLSKGYNNKIIGLELDPDIAKETAAQFLSRKNVQIICGDAIANLPYEGTVFYFYNPFTEWKVMEFERKMTSISESKKVKIIYYNPKSLHVFKNENWNIQMIDFEKDLGLKKWGRLNKYHDLAIITSHNIPW